jgi:protein MpaA
MNNQQEIIKPSIPYENPQKAIFSGSTWEVLGKSAGGHDICGKLLPARTDSRRILLIGGVHGNETEGVSFMEQFVNEFALNQTSSPFNPTIYVLPVFNPDGFLNFHRGNANLVDLNRNMPTKDWSNSYSEEKYFPGKSPASEPETHIMTRLLDKFKPDFILSFHSWKPMININGPAMPFAEAIYKKLRMEIVDDIGYPTPGSLGTYAGWERNIPTITIEFERGIKLDSVYPLARDGILESIQLL